MESDQAYRRGTVLGLTIAEVFILLVFLLLLILLLLVGQSKERSAEAAALERERERAWQGEEEFRQVLSVWEEQRGIPTPKEVETLHDRARNEALKRIAALEEALESAGRERVEEEDLARQMKALREQLEEAAKERNEALKQGAALEEALESAGRERVEEEDLARQMKALREQLEEAAKEGNEALKQSAALEEALESAEQYRRVSEKGQDPPCWYETIVNERKTRERPHYLLNIAVFDDAMIILPRPFPEGAADDDGGEPYVKEAQRLPLAGLPYGKPLDDETLRRHLEPIHDLGKAAKVRTYPCTFWVAVWDETSEGAKTRWQEAHDRVLEGLFGTYTFQNVPWPGGLEHGTP